MSWIAVLAITVTLVAIISQFGKRLAARNALIWWSVGIFIILVAALPDFLKPLIQALGIQLVSNFLLAGLIMFLFLQVLELTAESTTYSRMLRRLVSNLAADAFTQKNVTISHNSSTLKVLILLPSYNEEDAIASTLGKLKKAIGGFDKAISYFICFVDDGSVDRSSDILRSACPNFFTSHSVNIGVAGALMTGFSIAQKMNFDYVVQFDADGQHPANEIETLVRTAISEKWDMTIGSRFAQATPVTLSDTNRSTTRSRILGIIIIRHMLSIFGSAARITDPTSGFRVYSRYAQSILSKHMPDEYPEPESVALLAMHKARVGEVRVEMEARSTGVSSINGFKTVRFMAKVLAALIGLRLRSAFSR